MSTDKSSDRSMDERDAYAVDDVDLEGAVGGWITQTVTRAIETGRSGTARSGGDVEDLDLNKLGL